MDPVPSQTTWQKYTQILSSPRFHQIVASFLVQAAAHYGWIDPWLANAITVTFLGSVTVGTVDKLSQAVAQAPAPMITLKPEQTNNVQQ